MNITRFAIEKKRITSISLFIIALAGILTFINMPRAEDPGFIIRVAQIVTTFPGASPERVELLVTDKLEKKIQEMPEVKNITSESKPGVSIVLVEVSADYTDMRPIWDKLRRKVELARVELPQNIIGPNVNDEFGDVFGTVVAITGEGYTYAELKEIADDCRNELLLIDLVAKVEISGAQQERVFVEFNNARLAELGITPAQLQQILGSRNIIFPGGQIYTENEQIALEPSGNFESVEELKRTIINLPGRNELLYLQDIAKVYRGYIDPPTSKMTYNGTPTLGLSISMRDKGNIITLGENIKNKLQLFQSVYPIGVEFNVVYFQPYYVEKKVDDFVGNLVQAVAIVIVIMLFTLGFRTGLVVASLIPMAMIMALFIMGFFEIGLDQMSLAALIIALGMLVDNAIVMSESILVQMQEGKKAVDAAIDSASELRISLLTSSLTTAAAFLPIYLAESDVGEYTAPLFKVVTITLLSSWVLSLTMIPLLCVLFIKVKAGQSEDSFNTRFYRVYRNALLSALKHPFLSIAITIGIFFSVMNLLQFIPAIFFPANDKPVMYAKLEFPIGTPLSKTEAMIKKVNAFVKNEMMAEYDDWGEVTKEGVVNFASFIGSSAPRYVLTYNPAPPNPGYTYMIINTTSRDLVDTEFVPKLEKFCFENFPDLDARIEPLSMGPPVNNPVEIRVSGKDLAEIYKIVDKLKYKLSEIPGTKNIIDNWGPQAKKLFVRVNQPRALRAGVTSQDVAISLQTILSGIKTTDYREDDEVIPVILRSVEADRKDVGKLESHNVYSQLTGRSVPLKQVADIEVQFQPAKILRRDRQKTVTIESNITSGSNAIAISAIMDEWLKEESKSWPIGYKYELGGEVESSGEANEAINAKLPISMLIIILLLVSQFDSLRRPAIILMTIPLGLIGVVIGLFITQSAMGFMAFLGVISLAGIVINNAIVLIDRIKIEIEENGLEPARAVLESAQRRLRPILLTTATTVGGLVPLWLGGGPMFESMAVAILFGLIFATALTLGFVPILYSIFFRVKFKEFEY